MDRARPGDGPGARSDDKVGSPREVRFSGAEIARAETGELVRQEHRIQGDGGDYTLVFVARNRGQSHWAFCTRCNAMFFNGMDGSDSATTARGMAVATR